MLRAANKTKALASGASVRSMATALRDQAFNQDPLKVILKVTQSSTDAPTVVALRNDLAIDIDWAYTGVGIYTGTATGMFLEDKVIPAGKMIDTDTEDSYTLRRGTDDTIILETGRAGTLTNALLTGEIIEFSVLNSSMTAHS